MSPRRPAGSGRVSTSAPELGQEVGDPAPDRVDAGRRVAAAVDVDEALEVGEVGRQVGADGGAQARRARSADGIGERLRSRSVIGRQSSALARLLSCAGPCAWSRSACSRVRTSTGSSRWSSSRSPSGGGGRGTGSAIRDATRSSTSAPRCRPATGPTAVAAIVGLDPPAARRPRRGPRRPGGPSLVRSGPLDRHLPVGRCRTRPDPDRGGARARRARRLAVADAPA